MCIAGTLPGPIVALTMRKPLTARGAGAGVQGTHLPQPAFQQAAEHTRPRASWRLSARRGGIPNQAASAMRTARGTKCDIWYLPAAAGVIITTTALVQIASTGRHSCFGAQSSGLKHRVPDCRCSSTLNAERSQFELSLPNAVQQLDAGDRDRGICEPLEAEHHRDALLNAPMVLLD